MNIYQHEIVLNHLWMFYTNNMSDFLFSFYTTVYVWCIPPLSFRVYPYVDTHKQDVRLCFREVF